MDNFVLLVSVFIKSFSDSYSRINNVYDYCPEKKQIVTADFDHHHKCKRIPEEHHRNIVQLSVPSYTKNIGFKRFYSHLVFALKLHQYLKKLEEKPSLIYCAMPTSSSAYICGRFCKRNNIRFVIDIIDIWPESLVVLLPFKRFFGFILKPWFYISRRAYKMADVIFAESKYYADLAKKYNEYAKVYTCYIGIDMEQIVRLVNASHVKLEKPPDEVWICYGGNFGLSYDFDVIFDALNALKNKPIKYRFFFIGDGVRRKEIEQKIKKLDVNAEITGSLDYKDFLKFLSFCDIGINAFKNGTEVAFSYKFNDYVAANLFILNNLKGETSEMIEQYKIGKNFNYSDVELSDILSEVISDINLINSAKANCKHIASTVLNKKSIYKSMIQKMF